MKYHMYFQSIWLDQFVGHGAILQANQKTKIYIHSIYMNISQP